MLAGRRTSTSPSHPGRAPASGYTAIPAAFGGGTRHQSGAVGDAISRLEAEGLVESKPRAGTRVRIATAEEVRGNYVLREALETHSARLFAESARPRPQPGRPHGRVDRLRLSRADGQPEYSARGTPAWNGPTTHFTC